MSFHCSRNQFSQEGARRSKLRLPDLLKVSKPDLPHLTRREKFARSQLSYSLDHNFVQASRGDISSVPRHLSTKTFPGKGLPATCARLRWRSCAGSRVPRKREAMPIAARASVARATAVGCASSVSDRLGISPRGGLATLNASPPLCRVDVRTRYLQDRVEDVGKNLRRWS